MDENLHNQVDKLFQDPLKSHREDISPEVWNRIEEQLDKDDELLFNIKKKKHLWIIASLFVFLTGVGALGFLHYQSNKPIPAHSAQNSRDKLPLPANNLEKKIQTPGNIAGSDPMAELIKLKRSDGIALEEKRENQTNSGKSEYHSYQNPQDLNTAELFNSSNLKFYPFSVNLSPSDISSIHTEKTDFSITHDIPEKMIVKPEKQKLISRFSLTPYFSQEFAGYNLSDDDATAANGREIEQRERNAFSASVGVYLNYRLDKRWVIQSGISYSWSRSNIDSAKSFAVLDNSGNVQFKLNTISGYGYLQPDSLIQSNVGDSILTAKSHSEIHYLTVPLILSYKFPIKRFSLQVGAGVSMNFLTGAIIETKIYGPNFVRENSSVPINGLKKINFGVIVKAELEYRINSKWGFDLIPSFKNSVSPINIHSALSAYPYNFGIGFGINYRF
jgi:hypothetical protein